MVLIHDVIPLDFPEFQRDGTVVVFRKKVKLVREFADVVIYNSADTRTCSEAQMQQWGSLPEGIVSHLGDREGQHRRRVRDPQSPLFRDDRNDRAP